MYRITASRQAKGPGRIVMITGDKYQNVKTGRIYILKKLKNDTILLQEENGEGQILMSYKEFEEGYVKLRSSVGRR